MLQPGESGTGGLTADDEAELSVDVSTDSLLVSQASQQQQSAAATSAASSGGGVVLALDAAILRSVDQCPTDELKKKVLSSVLLVGQGRYLLQ